MRLAMTIQKALNGIFSGNISLKLRNPVSFAVWFFLSLSAAAEAQHNALVINNYDYAGQAIEPGKISGVATQRALESRGLTVTLANNVTSADILDRVSMLAESSEQSSGLTVLYYRGHSAKTADDNYFIPVESTISDTQSLQNQGVAFSDVLTTLGQAVAIGGGALLVVVDAGRPYFESLTGDPAADGFKALPYISDNTLVLLSNAPESTPSDSGVFQLSWNKVLRKASGDLNDVVDQVKQVTNSDSVGALLPHYESNLGSAVTLAETINVSPGAAQRRPSEKANELDSRGTDTAGKNISPASVTSAVDSENNSTEAKLHSVEEILSSAQGITCDDSFDKSLWDEVIENQDAMTVEDYVLQFPGGCFINQASLLRDELVRRQQEQEAQAKEQARMLAEQEELERWNAIKELAKSSGDTCVYGDYVREYPDGRMVVAAKRRLETACESWEASTPVERTLVDTDSTPPDNASKPESADNEPPQTEPVSTAADTSPASPDFAQAKLALENNKCATPEGDSVLYWTRGIGPGDAMWSEVHAIYQTCILSYLNWAQGQLDQGQPDNAKTMLDRAGLFYEFMSPLHRKRSELIAQNIQNYGTEQSLLQPEPQDKADTTATPRNQSSEQTVENASLDSAQNAATDETVDANTNAQSTEEPNLVQKTFRWYRDNRDGGISGQGAERK